LNTAAPALDLRDTDLFAHDGNTSSVPNTPFKRPPVLAFPSHASDLSYSMTPRSPLGPPSPEHQRSLQRASQTMERDTSPVRPRRHSGSSAGLSRTRRVSGGSTRLHTTIEVLEEGRTKSMFEEHPTISVAQKAESGNISCVESVKKLAGAQCPFQERSESAQCHAAVIESCDNNNLEFCNDADELNVSAASFCSKKPSAVSVDRDQFRLQTRSPEQTLPASESETPPEKQQHQNRHQDLDASIVNHTTCAEDNPPS